MRKTKEEMSLAINEVLRKIHYGEITIGKGTNLITESSQYYADQEMEAFSEWVEPDYTYIGYGTWQAENEDKKYSTQQLIQKYKEQKKLIIMAYQCCPLCNGTGSDPTAGMAYSAFPQCPVCRGARIISEVTGLPPIYEQKQDDKIINEQEEQNES